MATLDQFENSMQKLLDRSLASFKVSLITELDEKFEKKAEAANSAHAARYIQCESQIGTLQDYLRRNNIIIHNLPYQYADGSYANATGGDEKEDRMLLKKQLIKLFDFMDEGNEMGGDFAISTFHRIPTRNSKASAKPVVVQFYIRDVRDRLLSLRKRAKSFIVASEKPVFVAEHLGPQSLTVLTKLKDVQREGYIMDVWITRGVLFVKQLNNSVIRGQPTLEGCLAMMEKLNLKTDKIFGYPTFTKYTKFSDQKKQNKT